MTLIIRPKHRLKVIPEEDEKFIIEASDNMSEEIISEKEIMDINIIACMLMSYKIIFNMLSLQTTKYSKHTALEKLYKCIDEVSDDILKALIVLEGCRFKEDISIKAVPFISQDICESIVNHLQVFQDFVYDLKEFCKQKEYKSVSKYVSKLDSLIVQTLYKLTLH